TEVAICDTILSSDFDTSTRQRLRIVRDLHSVEPPGRNQASNVVLQSKQHRASVTGIATNALKHGGPVVQRICVIVHMLLFSFTKVSVPPNEARERLTPRTRVSQNIALRDD